MVDSVTLEEVLSHLHNWFEKDSAVLTVSGCEVAIPDQEPNQGGEGDEPPAVLPDELSGRLSEGQWYRIEGSWLNDGLHCHPASDLKPETFDGTVTLMRIPRPLLRVAEDIAAWKEKNASALDSPYASESFGGYTYTLKGGLSPQNGSQGLSGWYLAFRDRLNPFRKLA